MGKRIGYIEIIDAIKNAPLTQLPAILIAVVETCIKRKVFISNDKLVNTVNKVIKLT